MIRLIPKAPKLRPLELEGVAPDQVAAYERLGWVVSHADRNPQTGVPCVMMLWDGVGEVKRP